MMTESMMYGFRCMLQAYGFLTSVYVVVSLICCVFGPRFDTGKMYVHALLRLFRYVSTAGRKRKTIANDHCRMHAKTLTNGGLNRCAVVVVREPVNQSNGQMKGCQLVAVNGEFLNDLDNSFDSSEYDDDDDEVSDHETDDCENEQTVDCKSRLTETLLKQANGGNAQLKISGSGMNMNGNACPKHRRNGFLGNGTPIKKTVISRPQTRRMVADRLSECKPIKFELGDIVYLVKSGMDAILDDQVTKRFRSVEELDVWNLLTRNRSHNFVRSKTAWLIWIAGFLIRYGICLPCRLSLFVVGMTFAAIYAVIMSITPSNKYRQTVRSKMAQVFFRISSRVLSAVITIHNPENRARPGSICVANHTSPVDAIILSTDNGYALTGQRQSGFFGIIEKLLEQTGDNIWFDRAEESDRTRVLDVIDTYITSSDQKLPVLIFPEGTCINNTSVMMFRKGSFEIDAPVYPVAIKYDQRLGDPFWNSHLYGFLHYFFLMMTSWAIAVDVYYLPKMERRRDETSICFAKRVKMAIADAGGFVDMDWDGMLKRNLPKSQLRELEQKKIYEKQFKVE